MAPGGLAALVGRGAVTPLRALFEMMPAGAPSSAALAAERRELRTAQQREREEARAVQRRERAEAAQLEQREARRAIEEERRAIRRESGEMRSVQSKLRDSKVYGEERQALNRELEQHKQSIVESTRRIDSHTRTLDKAAMRTHGAHQERIQERIREGEPVSGHRRESDMRLRDAQSETERIRAKSRAIRDQAGDVKPDIGAYRPSSVGYDARIRSLTNDIGQSVGAHDRHMKPVERASMERGGTAQPSRVRSDEEMEAARARDVRMDKQRAAAAEREGTRLRTNTKRLRAQHEVLQRAIEDKDRAAADRAARQIERLAGERRRIGGTLQSTVSVQHGQREAHGVGVPDDEVRALREDDARVRDSSVDLASNARRAADEMRVGPIKDADRMLDESETAGDRMARRGAEEAETQAQYESRANLNREMRQAEEEEGAATATAGENEEGEAAVKGMDNEEGNGSRPLVGIGEGVGGVGGLGGGALGEEEEDGLGAAGGGIGGGGGPLDSDSDDDEDDDEDDEEDDMDDGGDDNDDDNDELRARLVSDGTVPPEVAHVSAKGPWRTVGMLTTPGQDEVRAFVLVEWMGNRRENNSDRPLWFHMSPTEPIELVRHRGGGARHVRLVLHPRRQEVDGRAVAPITLNTTWKAYEYEHMSDEQRAASVVRQSTLGNAKRIVRAVVHNTVGRVTALVPWGEHRAERSDWTRAERHRDEVPPDVPFALVVVTQVNRRVLQTKRPDDYAGPWRYDIGGYVADRRALYGARMELRSPTGYFTFPVRYEADIDSYVHESDVVVPVAAAKDGDIATLRLVFAHADWTLQRIEYILSMELYDTVYERAVGRGRYATPLAAAQSS